MTAHLSNELQRELARHDDQWIRLKHPKTHKVYVLIDAESFDRLQPLLDHGTDTETLYAAEDKALAEVWNDPALDAYADYEHHRPRS
ncbi:MAG: hypothetical protein WCG83_03525 [Candidatus Peregrinibacteria bacterium]